ncbi:hypothetical protein LTR10_013997 [Elasticomyces elasticus]|nr:hypothetical protein LTR10_013997 [Elasticomyces elasticus]KAK4974423.1 hypothetical protein LTR42_005067 [Elasticomyces elasticus]
MDAASETDSLLPPPRAADVSGMHTADRPPRLFRPAIVWALVVQFLSALPYYLLIAPKLKLLELAICRDYHSTRDPGVIGHPNIWPGFDIDERLCKERTIQQKVSYLRAWSVFIEAMCGTLPDIFSVNATLWSNSFLVIGCGSYVLFSMTTTLAMDVTSHAERPIVLYWVLCANILAYTAGSALATGSMQTLWLPYALALVLTVLAVLVVLIPRVPSLATLEATEPRTQEDSSFAVISSSHWADFAAGVRNKASTIGSNKRLCVTLLLFPLMASRGPLAELALPYSSKRYGWSLRTAASLDMVNGAVGLVTNAMIVPKVISTLERRNFTPLAATALIAKCSALNVCIGCVVTGSASLGWVMLLGWTCYSTGSGVRMAVLSMATSLVSPQDFATLNSLIVTIETLADLTIVPLIWSAWSGALAWDKRYLGLPWFVTAAAYILVLGILSLTPFSAKRSREPEADTQQGPSIS